MTASCICCYVCSHPVTLYNRPATGAASVTFLGAVFSTAGASFQAVRVHNRPHSDSLAVTMFGASVPGVTMQNRPASGSVSVTLGGDSLPAARAQNMACTGSTSLTLLGASFGVVTKEANMSVGRTACAQTEWESSTSMTCRVGHATLVTATVGITVGQPLSPVATSQAALRRAVQVRRTTVWAGVHLPHNPFPGFFTAATSLAFGWLHKTKLLLYRVLTMLLDDAVHARARADVEADLAQVSPSSCISSIMSLPL